MKENVKYPRPEKVTAGLDWFRWKMRHAGKDSPTMDHILTIQQEDYQRGEKVEPWSFQGFRGWKSPSIRYGLKDLELIWESSGETTHSTLIRMPPSSGVAKRLDLHTTLTFSSPQEEFGEQCLKYSTPMPSPPPSNTPLVGRSRRTDGLYCGTVGKRTHPRYWRVYDKGIESRSAPKGHVWRLELEAKGTLAEELCKTYRDQLTDPTFCAQYCVSSWRAQGHSWPVGFRIDEVHVVDAPRKPPSSITGLMFWAMQSVRPVTQRLLRVYSVAEVLEALGLSGVASPKEIPDA